MFIDTIPCAQHRGDTQAIPARVGAVAGFGRALAPMCAHVDEHLLSITHALNDWNGIGVPRALADAAAQAPEIPVHTAISVVAVYARLVAISPRAEALAIYQHAVRFSEHASAPAGTDPDDLTERERARIGA